ncbi:MAG: phosphodiester glycosidase family protein [Clostridia bacterium]|nr:phosphodiester glycosidase family protein [Clostridia bacterium]
MTMMHAGRNRFAIRCLIKVCIAVFFFSVLIGSVNLFSLNAHADSKNTYRYDIQVLCTSEVFVNGVKLTEEFITENDIASIYDSHLLENAISQKECVYTFVTETQHPEIIVKDYQGRLQTVEKTDDGYYAHRNWDDEEYTEFVDRVEKTMQSISKYLVRHETLGNTLKYVELKSAAYKYLDLYGREGSEKALHGYTYENTFIGEFVHLSEDSFACTARSTFSTPYSTKGIIVNEINYLLFYRKGPEGWKAYDIVFRPIREPDEVDERFKNLVSEGIELQPVTGNSYFGYMMIVHDPSRVFVGSSSKSFKQKGLTIDEMVEKYGAIGGINANGFSDPKGSGNGSSPFGTVVVDGEVLREDYKRGAAGFDQNNVLHAGKLAGKNLKELGIRDAGGWGPALVINGEPQKLSELDTGLTARSAIGQRADGAVLFLFIEGRHANCPGASYPNMVDVMLQFGAVNACNLDGGYSSVMYLNGERISDVLSLEQSRRMPVAFLIRAE